MTKEEKIELLRDKLIDYLFDTPDDDIDVSHIDALLDELDKLEPFAPFDVEEGLRQFREQYGHLMI